MPSTASIQRPDAPALRAWHLAVLVPVLALCFRLGLPTPRALTADEVDTLRGGHRLVDLMTTPAHDPRLQSSSIKGRLVAGFAPAADNPRAPLVGDSPTRRAVLEAPLPRWLAALGIGVLPVTDAMTNLERAASASALATSLALAILLWTFRRRGPAFLVGLTLAYVTLPPIWEAAASAGYAASALLAGALFVAALERLLATGRGALTVGLAAGLALAVHPLAISLAVAVFVAWALVHRGERDRRAGDGTLALPAAPLTLFLVPLVALVALVAVWPSLWVGTGKRLGAWLIDFGTLPHATHTVLGVTYDQTHRAAQAFTAVYQWAVWTPLPILGLWAVGLVGAIRRGRTRALVPVVVLGSLLIAASLDSSLFGARLSLLPLVLVPTVITAASGFEALVARGDLVRTRQLALAAAVFAIPAVQVVRGSTFGLARQSGAELRRAMPVALLEESASREPHAKIAAMPDPEAWAPALEAAREDLELELEPTPPDEAGWLIVAHAPQGEASAARGDEVARDARTGIRMSLVRRTR